MAAALESVKHFWKNFDLPALQKELDSTATELAGRQDESDANRKKLVDLSRDFKKSTPEDVRKLVAPLLKSFQGEIDSLSKRSKNAEAAFLSVYKKLIDLPDPAPVLDHAVEIQKKANKAQDLDLENKKLRETLEEYNNEFAEVKNQEVTIKGLREKLKEYEEKMESTAQARAKEKERELARQFAEKERQLQETQMAVAKKLGEAEHRVATLQSALDSVQSELFDLKAKYDEATSAKSDEVEIIMADVERANEKAVAAEREAERLKAQLASATQNLQQAEDMNKAPDMEQAIDILKRSSLEVELSAKEKEIAQLVEDVHRLQATVTKLRDSGSSQLAKLEEEIAAKNRAFSIMEDKLRTQDDYEEMKRELSILKSIEFNHSGEEDGEKTSGENVKAKSLEILLLEKNRSLQTENTQLKVGSSELTGAGTKPPKHALAKNTEVFASMLGQEIVANYQNQLQSERSPETPGKAVSPAASSAASSKNSVSGGDRGVTPERGGGGGGAGEPPTPTTPSAAFHPHLYHNGQLPPTSPLDGVSLQRLQSLARTSSETNNNNSPGLPAHLLNSPNCQVLDTASVAQKIREVLSAHNIGQRLFAKHVLGLSQGTVSELLSKPKHWDKLTEKGRESYRKMHAWVLDEANVHNLKAISPKKGAQPSTTNYRQEDSHTEERIAQILSDAQVAMQAKQSHEKVLSPEVQTLLYYHNAQITNAMVASIYQQELAKISGQAVAHGAAPPSAHAPPPPQPEHSPRPGGSRGSYSGKRSDSLDSSGRGRRIQADDKNLSEEMVSRIYREELVKLARQAQKSGNPAEFNMYQQELQRIAVEANKKEHKPYTQMNGHISPRMETHDPDQPQDLSTKIKKEPTTPEKSDNPVAEDLSNKENIRRPSSSSSSSDRRSLGADEASQEALRHAGSAFFLVRPRSNNNQLMYDQAMLAAAQANAMASAMANMQQQQQGGNSNDPMSPLQRMQSIANSIMTKQSATANQILRPLKAVLPPVTQEEFDRYGTLNTDDLVKRVKDSLSQFSISQRLFGEHVLGLSQGSVSDLLARPKPWHMLTQKGREPFIRMQIFLEDPEAIPKLVANQYRIAPDKLLRSDSQEFGPAPSPITSEAPSHPATPKTPQTTPTMSLPTTPVTPVPAVPITIQPMFPIKTESEAPTPPAPSRASSNYEVAAMTQELDTLIITSKVKEVLQFHNLGQKLFGEAVLGLSQGSVSELLSKPKPWHMLSLKGREPFIKMHMWLQDPHRIDRLRLWQTEQKAHKRRKSGEDGNGNSSDVGPSKRPRVFFTEDQKETLRLAYQQDPYPNQQTIECLANQLGVAPKTIINWFHNHRMRAKQQVPSSGSGTPVKSEDDAMSNHSDSMSVSSDNSFRQGNGSGSGALSSGGGADGSTSQWMFPSFEPIRRASGNSERNDLLAASDQLDAERLKSSLSCADADRDLSLLIDNNNLPHKHATSATTVAAAVTKSKRKSAKPQWSYEGTQLDKSRKSSEDAAAESSGSAAIKDIVSSTSDGVSTERTNGVNARSSGRTTSPITTTSTGPGDEDGAAMETDLSQQQDEGGEDGQRNVRGRLRNKKHLNCAIEKLQLAVNAKESDWDEQISSPAS